jgi:hypothetical protein
VIGPVNINVAIVSIDFAAEIYACLISAQPENARRDEISFVFGVAQFVKMVAGIDASFEHRARRSAGADFFRDVVQPARSAERVLNIGGRTERSGDHAALAQSTVIEKHEQLLRDTDTYDTTSGLDSQRHALLFHPF